MTWTVAPINILVWRYLSLLCCFLCCSPGPYVGQILSNLTSQTSVDSLRRSGSRPSSSGSFLNKNTDFTFNGVITTHWESPVSMDNLYFILTRRNTLVYWSLVRSIGFKWDEEICWIGMDDSGQEFDIKRLKHYWSHSFRWKIKWSMII